MTRTTAPDTARAVLDAVRVRRTTADRAEAEQLQLAVDWAAMHSVDSLDAAAVIHGPYGDHGIPVAGPGAPLVAEFAVTEFALAIGLSTDAGRRYVGQALELRYRLPKVWARVVAGDLVTWKARRIADATMSLCEAGAAFADTHVAAVAHKIGMAALDRLVEEALVRFQPEDAEARRRAAADERCFDIDTDQVSFEGTMAVRGELDIADALDLDAAVAAGAAQQQALGSVDPLGVRRAKAVGDLARRQLALDLGAASADSADTADSGAAAPDQCGGSGAPGAPDQPHSSPDDSSRAHCTSETGRRPRQVVLYVHLSQDALRARTLDHTDTDTDHANADPDADHADSAPDADHADADPDTDHADAAPDADNTGHSGAHLARVENTRSFVSADQIAAWCATPDAQITVKPVIDLEDHIHVNAYETPDRLVERLALIDHTCVFPWCTRPARKVRPDGHRADCDHIHAHHAGGTTCSCNLAPLCRRHHRHKTHSPWSYTALDAGTYLWTSPQGYQYLRDHTGTLDVSRDRHPRAPRDPHDPHRAEPPDVPLADPLADVPAPDE